MFNATLTGNLGRDPELKTTQSGQMVSSLNVAVRQPKRNGEDQPAFWVKVEVWGKQAEYCCDYLRKGNPVCCTGSVAQEEWTDKATGDLRRGLVMKNASVEGWASKGDQPARQSTAGAGAGAMDDDDDVPF